MPTERTCGDETRRCTACCKTHTFPGFKISKSAGTWCRYCERGKGCGVFDDPTRPFGCGEYKCGWLSGAVKGLKDKHRPDMFGLIFDPVPIEIKNTIPIGFVFERRVIILKITESQEGALRKAEALNIVENYRKAGGIIWIQSFAAKEINNDFDWDPTLFSPSENESIRSAVEKLDI